mmetsp:Transcript_20933/g.31803  ORF Transcript_20933/g.31803 Transcript_20933/m.31803 type:complete len:309 (-) Transcript_20933:142-1068(-)
MKYITLSATLTAVVTVLAHHGLTNAFSTPSPSSLSTLLSENGAFLSELREVASSSFPDTAPTDDIFYLRYCLSSDKKSKEEIIDQLKSTLEWRSKEGKEICDSAATAIAEATSSGGWNNDPVRAAAPHAASVNKFISSSQCLTITTNSGDLCYCIRAGKIDDTALMSEVSVDEMAEFFLYAKEINALVANSRSKQLDKLVTVLTANDLAGVQLVGGDATFRKALGAASSKANELYPNTAGPTFLLNLPRLFAALTKLFTPLFPKEVRKRLKFERGPLGKIEELTDISPNGNPAEREKFLKEVDAMLAN